MIMSHPLSGRARAAILAGILCFCAASRSWTIAHSQAISLDGVIYVRMAQALSQGLAQIPQVARQYDYHIGYAASISGIHAIASRLGLPRGVNGWDLAGKLISLISSLAALAAVWLFAERTFNWQTALMTTVLLAVSRKWAILGEDVLSDALALALQLWGILLALWTLQSLQRPGVRTIALAGLTGLCAGLGYLVRPEAILPAALAAVLWLAWQFRQKLQWKWTVASLLTLTLTALCCALPYILLIGAFTKKKGVDDLVQLSASHALPLATIVFPQHIASAAASLCWRIQDNMGIVLWVYTILWLLEWLAQRLMGWKQSLLRVEKPAVPEVFLMVGAAAVLLPILIGLKLHAHYLDYRHASFLSLLLSPLGGAEAWRLFQAMNGLMQSLQTVIRVAINVLVISPGWLLAALFTLEPIHADKAYEHAAAQRLMPLLAARDYVLTDCPRLLHYIAAPGELIASDEIRVQQRLAMEPRITWVALHDEAGAELHAPTIVPAFRETDYTGPKPHTLWVFKVISDALPK